MNGRDYRIGREVYMCSEIKDGTTITKGKHNKKTHQILNQT